MTGPAKRRARRGLRGALLVALGILYALSIPWYREAGAPARLISGLPDWVLVATACYAAAALLNALAWLLTDLHDEEPPDGSAGEGGRR